MTPRPRTPSGGDGTPGKPGDGSGQPGDGSDGRPSQVHGNIDASKGVSSAQETIGQAARSGRPAESGTPAVDPSVPGPAGKIQLRPPSGRHQLNQIGRKSPAKPKNTIIMPEARDGVRQDIADIQAGNARWDPATNSYVADSGRRYKVESSGTVIPVDGPGLVELSRSEFKALKALIAHNGDVEAAQASVAENPGIPPESFEKAGQVYEHYRK